MSDEKPFQEPGGDLPSILTSAYMERLLPDYLQDLYNSGKSPGTIGLYGNRIRAFLVWRQDRDLTLRLLVDYVIYLQTLHPGDEGEGCRPRTVRGHFMALASFWKYARLQGITDLPPIRSVPLPRLDRPHNVMPTDVQVDKLIAAAPRIGRNAHDPSFRAYLAGRAEEALTLLLWLGMRRTEALTLNSADFFQNEKGWRVRIKRSKGGEGRIIPVPLAAYERHRAWMEIHDQRCDAKGIVQPAVLLDPTCRRMGVHGLASVVEEIKLLAGLESSGITPHSLRHGCATLLVRAGVQIPDVQQILGHGDMATTLNYLHSDEDTVSRGMDRLGERLSGGHRVEPLRAPPGREERDRPLVRRPTSGAHADCRIHGAADYEAGVPRWANPYRHATHRHHWAVGWSLAWAGDRERPAGSRVKESLAGSG